MNAIQKAPAEGALAAGLRMLYEWMTREPVEIRDSRRPEAEEVQRLTPRGIADATAALLWAQRGSLTISADTEGYDYKGLHSPHPRYHDITIPGGINLRIAEDPSTVTIRAPDGATETVSKSDAGTLLATWKTIQTVNALDLLGIPVPEQKGGIRAGRAVDTLAMAIGDMFERADPPRADAVYETRVKADEGHGYTDDWQEHRSSWQEVGAGVYLSLNDASRHLYSSDRSVDNRVIRVMTASHGVVQIPYRPVHDALERRKRSSFAAALGIAHELPVHLPAPRGNAKATRILQLCREAVAAEPELADAAGTPIAPLVNRFLPDLMRIHAEATTSAPADQLAMIDAELMTGIERVRRAVDEALQVSANQKRDALRTQLAFLEMRHPDATI